VTTVLVGKAKLLTEYSVYQDGNRYIVEGQVRGDKQRRYAQEVTRAAVDTVASLLGDGFETIKDIARVVEDMSPAECGFRYRYRWQLSFEVDRALMVLVALGEASVRREGRRFVFEPLGTGA
jgi:hypothetical protein